MLSFIIDTEKDSNQILVFGKINLFDYTENPITFCLPIQFRKDYRRHNQNLNIKTWFFHY